MWWWSDYGAVWNGCFSPFPRTSVSYEEFAVQLDPHLPTHCIRYFFFFNAGREGRTNGPRVDAIHGL